MRQPPAVLVSRDQALTAELLAAAARAGCRMEVVPELTATQSSTLMAGRVLVGADVPEAFAQVPTATVVALEHHEQVHGRQSWLLPQDRAELTRTLTLLGQRPPDVPVVAVMGASGGVGATTLATGVAQALVPAAGTQGVALVDLTVVPDPDEPAGPVPPPDRGRGLSTFEAAGQDRFEATVRTACEHGTVVVADLPRWATPWLACVDAVAVVAMNRVGSLRNARRLVTIAQHHGLDPRFALATSPGGWWPADVAGALGLTPTVLWPTDRRLAQAQDPDQVQDMVGRGRLRDACVDLAEALLCASRSGGGR